MEKNFAAFTPTVPPAMGQVDESALNGPLEAVEAKQDLPLHMGGILFHFGRTAFFLWLDRAGLRVANLLIGIFLVRYLGPADFGLYIAALSIGGVASVAVDLGLTRYAARAVAANRDEASSVLAVSLFGTGASAAIEFLGFVFALFSGQLEVACIFIGVLLTNLEGTSSLCSAILTAELRSQAVLPGSLLSGLGMILVASTVILGKLPLIFLLAGIAVKSTAVVTARLLQVKEFWPRRSDWQRHRLLGVIRRARPYLLTTAAQMGYDQISVICLYVVASKDQVGWFSAGVVIAGVFPQLMFASTDAVLPVLTRLYESDRMYDLLDLKQRLLDLLLLICVPVVVLLAVFAPEICSLLGTRFASSATVLQILATRSLLSVLDVFFYAFLVATNRVKERRDAQFRALAFLTLSTAVFGAMWGATGAAFALFAADAALVSQSIYVLSSIKLRVNWPIWSTLASAVAMALTALLLPHNVAWVLKPAPALVVYLAVLAVFARTRLLSATRTLRECFGKARDLPTCASAQ